MKISTFVPLYFVLAPVLVVPLGYLGLIGSFILKDLKQGKGLEWINKPCERYEVTDKYRGNINPEIFVDRYKIIKENQIKAIDEYFRLVYSGIGWHKIQFRNTYIIQGEEIKEIKQLAGILN